MSIFEQASRVKLRFDLQGQVSTEQLWTANYDTLVEYEAGLTDTVESYGKSTRRAKTRRTKEQELNELRLAIVSHILNVRDEEAEAASKAAESKAQRQVILELIQRKKNQQLEEMSLEDLEKLL